MSITEGRWEGNTSFPDLQIFIGAQKFSAVAGAPTLTLGGPGLVYSVIPAATTVSLIADLALYLRTGVYASAYDQEQFGTASGAAGPTTVANTSGPLGLPPGFPPILAANMTTIAGAINGTGTGIQRGPIPKGIQIDSVDVIYTVGTLAATSVTIGLTKTNFVTTVAPNVANIIALGANGLPVAVTAQPTVTNVAVASPAMITLTDTNVLANLVFVTPATSTVNFYGINVRAHMNFN